VEIHVTLCRRDVRLAAVSLKSLLRFTPASLCLTDDGTLTTEDRRYLSGHFPGARWMERRDRDPRVAEAVIRRPALRRFYEGELPMAAKLLHPVAAADGERVIVLDPDTAFFRRPDRLLRWIAQGGGPLYLFDRSKNSAMHCGDEARETLERLGEAVDPRASLDRLPHLFFNSGLLACTPGSLDLDVADAFLAWWEQQPAELRTGNAGIWFGPWTREQMAYAVMLAAADAAGEAFGAEYHIGFDPGAVFNHFLGCNVARRDVLACLSDFAERLREESGPSLAKAG
jgi:hypothetical protein